jgi:murein DD-endopeptidase MepM/ murein hydrolase activator NlpD
MKRFLVLITALFVWTGQAAFADDFTVAGGTKGVTLSSTAAVTEPFVWPVSDMIGGKKVRIVSGFGRRKVPMIPGIDTSTVVVPADEMHEGVDFSVPQESNVRAARSGKVIFAGFSTAYVSRADKKDKNHLVILKHADGKSTRYVHLDRLRVRPGLEVKAGDVLGSSSASNEWTEPVVHFEIRGSNGKAIDPMTLLTNPQAPAAVR